MTTLKIGMDILAKEQVSIDSLTGHGGLFKSPGSWAKISCCSLQALLPCMETAGEGGPYGMALLASYMLHREDGLSLEDYLRDRVFQGASGSTVQPDPVDVAGFEAYTRQYRALLQVEQAAVAAI